MPPTLTMLGKAILREDCSSNAMDMTVKVKEKAIVRSKELDEAFMKYGNYRRFKGVLIHQFPCPSQTI